MAKVKFNIQESINGKAGSADVQSQVFPWCQDAIKLFVRVEEMVYGLPYKHDNHTTALINLIYARLEVINSKTNFAREQMIRTLHAEFVEAGKVAGKM